MNAAVFLKKGDVVRIIGSSVNARIHDDTIASYNPQAFPIPSPYLPRMKC
jgi:hypothetical protein